jgi:hypothetical protein
LILGEEAEADEGEKEDSQKEDDAPSSAFLFGLLPRVIYMKVEEQQTYYWVAGCLEEHNS